MGDRLPFFPVTRHRLQAHSRVGLDRFNTVGEYEIPVRATLFGLVCEHLRKKGFNGLLASTDAPLGSEKVCDEGTLRA
jgi:hypothetical protein